MKINVNKTKVIIYEKGKGMTDYTILIEEVKGN